MDALLDAPETPAKPVAPALPTAAGLRAKIAELDTQRQQHLANANACTGAIQFAQALLADLEGGSYA